MDVRVLLAPIPRLLRAPMPGRRLHCVPLRRAGRLAVLMLLAALMPAAHALQAQAPLTLVDDETTVREISFRFVDQQSLDQSQLKDQIALTEPSFFDRVWGWPPFSLLFDPAPHPFDPLVLARDVVRLRNYYERNGFLQTDISYAASQLDTTDNTIHVIFRVEEGPPLVIQDVNFHAPDDGYAVQQFEPDMRDAWIDFRDDNTFRTGERFTEFKYVRLQSDVLGWLKERGYAFPRMQSDSTVDRSANTIDLSFRVDAGPRGRVSEILVEGNESVTDNVVLRELPFSRGDRFNVNKLKDGQRELFALNLFRVALVDVPPADTLEVDTIRARALGTDVGGTDTLLTQPRDSTVIVRVRVREADLRYVTARTGYGRATGVSTEGRWRHRNFFGDARTFTVDLLAQTGFASTINQIANVRQRYQASVSLRQPYLFRRNLSGIVSPFVRYEQNELLRASEEYRGINYREYGLETTLLYEIYPFRTVSLQHTFSRVTQFTSRADTLFQARFDPYNRSIFTLSGAFGRTDDYASPSKGFMLRPYAEAGGAFLGSQVLYTKAGGEAAGYWPLSDDYTVAGRLTFGQLWPYDDQIDAKYEDRYDNIRLYAGGPNDLRGWAQRNMGPKFARPVAADTSVFRYESIGAERKLGGNVELRMPVPFGLLGSAWSTVAFLDVSYLDTGLSESQMRAILLNQVPEAYLAPSDLTRDALQPTALRYGTGVGLRYETIVGFIRLDFAYKVNPDPLDVRDPQDVYRYETGEGTRPGPSFWNRMLVHLSIGQAF